MRRRDLRGMAEATSWRIDLILPTRSSMSISASEVALTVKQTSGVTASTLTLRGASGSRICGGASSSGGCQRAAAQERNRASTGKARLVAACHALASDSHTHATCHIYMPQASHMPRATVLTAAAPNESPVVK